MFAVIELPGVNNGHSGVIREIPVCGKLWVEGAAAAGAGLFGELTGCDGVALIAGEAAAGVAGMSYFCSCSK